MNWLSTSARPSACTSKAKISRARFRRQSDNSRHNGAGIRGLMPKLRVLSVRQVLSILAEFGFHGFAQRGSHVKLRRLLSDGKSQTLTVPDRNEIDRGTLHAIYRQASRFIPE